MIKMAIKKTIIILVFLQLCYMHFCFEIKKTEYKGLHMDYSLFQEEKDIDLTKIKSLKMDKLIYSKDGSGLSLLQMSIKIDGVSERRKQFKAYYIENNYEEKFFNFKEDEYIKTIKLYYTTKWINAIQLITNLRESEILGDLIEDEKVELIELNGDLMGFSIYSYVNGFLKMSFSSILNCSSKCKTCIDNPEKCIICNEGYFKKGNFVENQNIDECLSSPIEGYFLKNIPDDINDTKFFPCGSSCKNCEGSENNCTECTDGYLQLTNPGVCSNTGFKGFYIDKSTNPNVLKKCNVKCEACIGPDKDQCITCSENYYVFFDDKREYKECFSTEEIEGNFFVNLDSKLIEPCDSICNGCKEKSNLCILCKENYSKKFKFDSSTKSYIEISNECFPNNNLITGFYMDTRFSQTFFKECDKSCLNCSHRPNFCDTCAPGYYLSSGLSKLCLKNPLSGFYLDKNSDNHIYKTCDPSCKSCGVNSNLCFECAIDYYHKIDSFKDESDLKIDSDNLILPTECFNKPPYTNYYFDPLLKVFVKCSENCNECEKIGKDKCLTCKEGAYFDYEKNGQTGICYSNLPAKNYYLEKILYNICYERCASCINGLKDGCTECNENLFRKEPLNDINFECYKDINEEGVNKGYFFKNNIFYKCSPNCKKCLDNSEDNCSECSDGYYHADSIPDLNSPYKKCFNTKPKIDYYLDLENNLYLPCDATCLNCDEKGSENCTSCNKENNLYFKEREDFYTNEEYFSFYNKISNDKTIDKDLFTQLLNLNYEDLKPSKANCINSIDFLTNNPNYFLDSSNNILRKCNHKCSKCNSINYDKCIECSSGYKFKLDHKEIDDFTCYDIDFTPFGYFNDESNKHLLKCSNNCLKCQNANENSCLLCQKNFYFKLDNFTQKLDKNGFIIVGENSNPNTCYENLNDKEFILINNLWEECPHPCPFKLNNFEDLTIKDIIPAYSGRYTMEFWFFNSNFTLNSGIHFTWKNLISITLIDDKFSNVNNNNLNVFCWPKEYKTNNSNNLFGSEFYNNINNLSSNKNKDINYGKNVIKDNNKWIFIRCSVDLDSQFYYILTNTISSIDDVNGINLKNDLISKDNFNEFSYKYIWQTNQLSEFSIEGANKNMDSTIYLHTLALFTEFLPIDYSFRN